MIVKIETAPAVEPVTLSEIKSHLRIDTGSFSDYIEVSQSITPGDHAVAADYSLKGTGVDVLNSDALVILDSGTNGAGGKVDVKIQEADADEDASYADWTGGAFTQVTTANDDAIQEIAYTGTKQYIRVVATVAVATCDFGVSVVTGTAVTTEDDLLTDYIETARRVVEKITNRALITQTWNMVFDKFPGEDFFEVPFPPLQSISSIKYYDTDDTEATFSSDYYTVDTYSELGRVFLNYGDSWPSTTLRPYNGVITQFVAGYGDAASDVPEEYKLAIKLLVGHYYENREAVAYSSFYELPDGVKSLLAMDRIIPV